MYQKFISIFLVFNLGVTLNAQDNFNDESSSADESVLVISVWLLMYHQVSLLPVPILL